jgi:four helix bundle protein
MPKVRSHRELRVYQSAMDAALRALELADRFPPEEKYAWRGQTHRSAPSVCANIAEAFRKRRYKPHFVSKLTDAEAEAAETQVWMELAFRKGCITENEFADIFGRYEKILAQLVLFEQNAKPWGITTKLLATIATIAAIATTATIATIAL